MLRVGHLNVYHLHSKVPDVCNFLKSQSSTEYLLFWVGGGGGGVTESRLDFKITDHSISIPDYYITRRDPQLPGQTGIAVYVRRSVQTITHRFKDLENDKTECIWLHLKLHAHGPSLSVCYLYRNSAVTFECYDSFV